MQRIVKLVESGRAFERLTEIFFSVLPSLIIGFLLIAIYFLLKLWYNKHSQAKAETLKKAAPWFYLVFAAVLWLSHNGVMDERVLELGINLSLTNLVFWAGHFVVFAVFGYLLQNVIANVGKSVFINVIVTVSLELIQYSFKLGSGSWTDIAATLLGALFGILSAHFINRKRFDNDT